MKKIIPGLAAVLVFAGCSEKVTAQTPPNGNAAVKANSELTAYANDRAEVVLSRRGNEYLRLNWIIWGPNWAWTWLDGTTKSANGVASGELTGKLSGTETPIRLGFKAEKTGPRALKITYSGRAENDTPLTMMAAAFNPGQAFQGTKATAITAGGNREIQVPFGREGVGEKVRILNLTDTAQQVTTLTFDPPIDIGSDGAARIVLAKDQMKGGEDCSVSITVEMPQDVGWFSGVNDIPDEPGLSEWFPWKATGNATDSLVSMANWNRDPAGKFGRVTRRESELIYNGKPFKLWGLNLCYSATAPEKALADKRAIFYKNYGINAVRMHKWADGSGWAGILTEKSAVQFEPEALDRFDYQISKLKEAGIFVKLSSNFGTLKLGVDDKAQVPWLEEFGGFRDGHVETPPSSIHYSPELQDVQIAQTVNLLKHRNPYTGMTYAEDPAISFVEIINEQSILFWTSMEPLKRSATLRGQVGKRFSDWLRLKYKDQVGLDAAWGDGAMNCFTNEVAAEGGESLTGNSVLPLGNPWFWDPGNLNTSQANRKQRLLDTLQFLTLLQDEFYARYTKAIRAAGYTGELVASNWQAGRALSHFANLHSDALVGTVDRHNYFGEVANANMISRVGSGILSSGMQQVANQPFMLSEWIHTFPNEYGIEGPAIIGAYGMGLQGWDASFMFQNGDSGSFSEKVGRETWDVTAPQILGVFPAVSRLIQRGDVGESKVIAARNIHFPSLFKGEINFDDKLVQGYDSKELDSSKVPARALAVARSVVDFTAQPKDTPVFSLAPYEKNGALGSSTDQLSWTTGEGTNSGYFTINTSATRAVVGFVPNRKFVLGDVTIEPESPFGAVYLTVREPEGTIETAKDLLVVAMARARNTGEKFSPDGAAMMVPGEGPILMEPVKAKLQLKRAGIPQVFVLDHDGKMTETKVPVENGVISIDGARDKAVYYLIRYAP